MTNTFFDAGGYDVADEPDDFSTLFGVGAGVAQAPVLLRRQTPGQYQSTSGGFVPRNAPGGIEGERFSGGRGAEESTFGGVVAGLYKQDKDTLIGLQQALWDGGWYGSKKKGYSPSFGFPDEDTLSAYSRAAKIAARYRIAGQDVTLDEVIAAGAAAGGAGGRGRGGVGGGTDRQPFAARISNRADVEAIAHDVAVKTLGRKLRPEEVEPIVARYAQTETAAQRAAYNAAEAGGVVQEAPSPQTFAEQQITGAAPVEAGAHNVAKTFDVFLRMLGGIGGS